jgi:hypothetical protein
LGLKSALFGLFVEIIEDHFVGDIADGGGEIAPAAFADMLELLLYLAR